MPIIKAHKKLVYFSHVPKCGGTSVERYLLAHMRGKVALLDHYYFDHPKNSVWNITSPQHVDGVSAGRFFPKGFLDLCFAVVRHPFARFQSAYKYQLHVQKTISAGTSISDFIKSLDAAKICQIGWCDNHFMTQHSFLIPGEPYKIFKLEDGLEPVEGWLHANVIGPKRARVAVQKIGRENTFASQIQQPVEDPILSPDDEATLRDLYAIDFKEFGYE